MKKTLLIACLLLAVLKTNAEENRDTADYMYGQIFYAIVDNLNVRETPKLSTAAFTVIKEGSTVVYIGEVSQNKTVLTLRGVKYNTPFIRVQLKDGRKGWIYAGALSVEMPLLTKEQKILKKKYDKLLTILNKIERQKLQSHKGSSQIDLDDKDIDKIKWNNKLYKGSYENIVILKVAGFRFKQNRKGRKIYSRVYCGDVGGSGVRYFNNGLVEQISDYDMTYYYLENFAVTKNGLKPGLKKKDIINKFGDPFMSGKNVLIYASYNKPPNAPGASISDAFYLYFKNNKLFAIKFTTQGYN